MGILFSEHEGIHREALFCDESEDFRFPAEPEIGDIVTIRFRTAHNNVDMVSLVEDDTDIEIDMLLAESDEIFDYFETQIKVEEKAVRYYFEVKKGDTSCYYNRLGPVNSTWSGFSFCITPGFHTPLWAQGALMYQIYVDRFRNGDYSNDVVDNEYIYIGTPVEKVKDWDEKIAPMDVGRFYGGDLQGILDKLDYLHSLWVEVIYLSPIFVSPSNHKYDCQDYEHVDPHYGVIVKDGGRLVGDNDTNNDNAERYRIRTTSKENLEASDAFFAKFVEEAHKRGMRVILDGVFNHCGSFNKWLDRERIYEKSLDVYESGAYVSKDSPYHSFFKFYNDNGWPYNSEYDGWWGHGTLPKLNYQLSENPEEASGVEEYVLNIARKWVSPPYNADGWRLDVAADLGNSQEDNHRFWKRFRKAVKEANPDAVILAEHYGDPLPWLDGTEWDSVMNYDAFMEPVSWFLTGMEKHSDHEEPNLFGDGAAFFNAMRYNMVHMQTSSVYAAMNELSNHDHSRFLTRTNRRCGRLADRGSEAAEKGVNYGLFRAGVVIQMTWPGSPTIYYGDEAGVCGWTDPDNRRTYPWGREDHELIEFHRYMTGIHMRIPALRRGSVKELVKKKNTIAYGRFQKNSRALIVVSTSSEPSLVEIPAWQIGFQDGDKLERIMKTSEIGYNVGAVRYQIHNGIVKVELEPYGAAVLTNGWDLN
ncbi:MAG: glycoside hydrolase family 13 protein [bacterium]|nr:glycoside hydrolase family 13 protein [bacterium]